MIWRRALLRTYPRSWREEYGEELAGLLARRPLTFAIVADILGSAAKQHLCRDEPWKICGAGLFVWTCFGMILDRYSLLTRTNFEWYSAPTMAAWFGTATWTVWRRNTGTWEAAQKAYWAAIAGQLPDLLAWVVSGSAGVPRLMHFYNWAPFSLFCLTYYGAVLGRFLAGLRDGLREKPNTVGGTS
jgi:hypothetical protein